MIALHLSFLNGTFFLWSEGSRVGDIKELRTAVKAVGLSLKILKGNTEPLTAWIPSCGEEPVPSSPLIGHEPDKRKKVRLHSFFATGRPLTLEELLELTAIAENGNLPGSGVIFGHSIAWAGQLLKTAFVLLAKESFLPTVTRLSGQWEARWVPVPDQSCESRLEKLTLDMPAVCRCLKTSAGQAPDVPRSVVVDILLTNCLDALIRRSNASEAKRKDSDSIHDAWLKALVSDDARIAWDNEREIRDFAAHLARWSRPVDLNSKSAFKFCFRLAEPEEGDAGENWRVDYLLQPKTDQSLILPLGELWKKNGKAVKHLQNYGGVPTEFILTALGQASGLCPDVCASLREKKPDGFDLDSNGAFDFLINYAEALRGAGFTVMLPSWWVRRGPINRLGLKAKVNSSRMQGGSNGLTLDAMVAFDFSASLGGEELSFEELKNLAELKAPLVKVRGQWTQIDQEQIRSAIHFLEKRRSQSISARELLNVALGADKQVDGLTVDTVEVTGWLNELLGKLTGRTEFDFLKQPPGFEGKLRHYQERGFSWLSFLRKWGLGACLADDMGLGKTVQTLALIEKEREAGEKRPVLLVCPTSVVNNWCKESGRFTPNLNVLVHHGSDRRKKQAFEKAAEQHALVVSSYGLLQRDVDFLKNVQWAGIILDEAQNIKNPETKQFKAARALVSDYRIALTGTPVENHVGDLWALMDFLNPGLLGNQNSFKNAFYHPIQTYRNTAVADKLKALTGPFILRRLKTDKSIISDLPEKMEMKEYCTLTKEQASLYQAVIDDMQEKIEQAEGINRRGLVLATLMKLKQVCNHPGQFARDNSSVENRSGKLERLREILVETRQTGERTLVFTQFAEMGSMMQSCFQEQFGEEVLFLHGGVPRKKRDEMVSRFQNDEKAPHIFILSLKAGGTGLTLTRANHVVHYDRWWNPAVENQATDRVFRIGQEKNVQVRKFIVAGTLEERIDDMIEKKTGIANHVVGTGEQWLSELSNEDLRDLIQLGSEAVGE
jgi:SNF2 family DNA or RNA helicase